MDQPTATIDPALMVQAAGLLLTALATFGRPGEVPDVAIAEIVCMAANAGLEVSEFLCVRRVRSHPPLGDRL